MNISGDASDGHSANPLTALMEEAVALSEAHVRDGGLPFAALLAGRDGKILGRGVNRVRWRCDPTAHAEVEAIRDACRNLGEPYLSGSILLASGEPCAMCYMSALFAGVSQICFAADRNEAAARGFDYRGSYKLYAIDPTRWEALIIRKLSVPGSLRPFEAFQRRGMK